MQRAKQISESIELGIILALAGGFMDVYSYIGRDHVFANAQTGNILLVGVSISEGNWALAGRYFFPVVSFAVGIMLADLVHERFGSVIHWRQVTVFFEAVILLGVSFIPGGGYNLLANCLTSFACGMQSRELPQDPRSRHRYDHVHRQLAQRAAKRGRLHHHPQARLFGKRPAVLWCDLYLCVWRRAGQLVY